jgi:integrase
LNLGLIETNVWHDVKVLGKSRAPEETEHYTLEEAENIITALVDHPKGQALTALACFAGLRPGELQGLRWSDLDPDGPDGTRAVADPKNLPRSRKAS